MAKPIGVLIEASSARDAQMRGLAEEAFGVLDSWSKRNHKQVPKLGRAAAQFGGWAVRWDIIDTDFAERRERWWGAAGHIQPLQIIFAAPGHTSGIGKDPGKGWVMVLPVLKADGDVSYLDTRLYGMRRTFVHEFIHYLDKGSDRARFDTGQTSAQRHDQGSALDYFLHPAEFNAYYQEGAHELDTTIASLVRAATTGAPSRDARIKAKFHATLTRLLPRRAQDFIKWHSNPAMLGGPAKQWSDNFLRALHHTKSDSKWLRKFQQRLGGLHSLLNKKYAKQIAGLTDPQ